MSKKSSFVKNPLPAEFAWEKDPGFTPPKTDGGVVMRTKIAPSISQAGHFKSLIDDLLRSIIGAANAHAGTVRLLSPHGPALQLISSVGLSADLLEAESAADSNCDVCRGVFNMRGIHSADLRSCKSPRDCRYAGCKIQSLISAAIESHAKPKSSIGVLTLYFGEAQDPFEHTSRTVLAFSRMLGAIIEYNKSNRDAKRVDLLAERQSIANEIHDSLAQTLVYTRMRTSLLLESIRTGNEIMVAKYAHDVDEALESSQKTVRELITDFRCSMDPAGLLHALNTLTNQFCQRNEIELEYLNQVANLELPLEYEIQVFHIVQEALANIAVHSGATHARLIVQYSGNNYVFIIEDNGSGGCTFTPVEGHYGMMIMRERAQRIGGEIKVESSRGFGTRVQLFFPEPGSDWRAVNE
jgi:two-component system, NarL family, nitrate/nitrite sensor histidine kinase NarX